MAMASVWMDVESQQFDQTASKLVWELLAKPVLLDMSTDTADVEENEAKLAKILDVYESRLAQSKYLGGECFTLADLHHLPTIHYLMGTQSKKLFDSRPHVNAWIADISARPAWLKVLDWQFAKQTVRN
jgi:glutathione S-transferase